MSRLGAFHAPSRKLAERREAEDAQRRLRARRYVTWARDEERLAVHRLEWGLNASQRETANSNLALSYRSWREAQAGWAIAFVAFLRWLNGA